MFLADRTSAGRVLAVLLGGRACSSAPVRAARKAVGCSTQYPQPRRCRATRRAAFQQPCPRWAPELQPASRNRKAPRGVAPVPELAASRRSLPCPALTSWRKTLRLRSWREFFLHGFAPQNCDSRPYVNVHPALRPNAFYSSRMS